METPEKVQQWASQNKKIVPAGGRVRAPGHHLHHADSEAVTEGTASRVVGPNRAATGSQYLPQPFAHCGK